MKFDFSKARCRNDRLGKRTHVCVSLHDIIGCKELSNKDKEPIRFAVDYIKTLEKALSGVNLERFGYIAVDSELTTHASLVRDSKLGCAIAIMSYMIANGKGQASLGDDPMDPIEFVVKRGWSFAKVYW